MVTEKRKGKGAGENPLARRPANEMVFRSEEWNDLIERVLVLGSGFRGRIDRMLP